MECILLFPFNFLYAVKLRGDRCRHAKEAINDFGDLSVD